jgi:Tfp pilus assembly protein PilV
MKKQKKAFSLIEVIIATWIISVTVFWVYKLIWENTKIISNSWNYLQANSLFPVLEECIENINSDFSKQSGSYNIFLWDSLTWCTNNTDLNIIDNIEYNLSATITSTWSKFIDWELSISSDEVKTMTWSYKQIKK